MSAFSLTKGNFGFGCMRLPMRDDEVDYEIFTEMVDYFLDAGFNYFDTAHGYIGGKSEIAIRECLSKRYKREDFLLANKLSGPHFNSKEEIRPLFESQLKACGVEYFDYYLMHSQHRNNFEKFKSCSAYETAFELKREGKIRHVGLSFHDTADILDNILTEYPEIEFVQVQFNYIDYDDASVQSRLVYETAQKHGKPVIVMEPVKGGTLVNLPQAARQILDELNGGTYASYAIRFAASFDNIKMVLSGMGDMDMMRDNVSFMKDFKPLDETEMDAIKRVCDSFREKGDIPCTNCQYCLEACPKGIPIPSLFACMNDKELFNNWAADHYYEMLAKNSHSASDCIKCGRCENVCPQHLPIREYLINVSRKFDEVK